MKAIIRTMSMAATCMVAMYLVDALPAYAAGTTPVPPPVSHTHSQKSAPTTFSGVITAVQSTSFTLMPAVTDSNPTPSPVTVTVTDSTKIVMRGDADASLSDLAVGYHVLVTTRADAMDAQPYTLILVSPKDVPVGSPHHENAL